MNSGTDLSRKGRNCVRKLCCVPMIVLLFLTGCSGRASISEGEELALAIRGEFLEASVCTASAEVTADYGQRVCRYEMDVSVTEEETLLVITGPETVAGITARIRGEEGLLEYDGVSVETGILNQDGLTPVSSVPVLLEAVRSGYMISCMLDEESGLLRVDCGDPEGTPGQGVEITLWFEQSSHALIRGEIMNDGFRVIDCAFSQFTKE